MAHPVVLHERATEGTVWTVGHSTHSFAEFLDILQAHAIETVADVRRFPGSRRHPQFGAEPLGTSLAAHGIDHHWFSGLGWAADGDRICSMSKAPCGGIPRSGPTPSI